MVINGIIYSLLYSRIRTCEDVKIIGSTSKDPNHEIYKKLNHIN
jgi:hypothetical protein